jgi:Family of unknown function (DUF6152)
MFKKFALAAAILALPSAAIAHHGWSSYDEKKVIKHRAALTDVKWGNPHGTAKVRYKNATWDVILAPVPRMEARGLSQQMVGPKQQVVLEGYPRRDGTREMRIERVTAGGRTVELR